jgi:hypothetical protein
MAPILNQLSVTPKSTDLIYVDILNDSLLYESFEYVIYGNDKTMIRRGQFRAPSVQIRTNYLEEGTYHFQLLLNGKEWKTTYFEKQNIEA